jgi:hypothetical protein
MALSSARLTGQSDGGQVVALWLRSLMAGARPEENLRKTLCASRGAVRVLVCIPKGPAEPLLSMRAALSREMKKRLNDISNALDGLIRSGRTSPRAWQDVPELAYEAAEATGAENSFWHHLVQRHRDELP